MSLPHEQQQAVIATERFLWELQRGTIPRVPHAVKLRAQMLLRHFPCPTEIEHMGMPGERHPSRRKENTT